MSEVKCIATRDSYGNALKELAELLSRFATQSAIRILM